MMEYQTNDMWLTAFLLSQGALMERLLTGKGKRKTFVLSWSAAELTAASRDYYRGAARVDPRELRHRLTDLKGMMSSRTVPPSTRKDKHNGAPSGERNTAVKREEDTRKSD